MFERIFGARLATAASSGPLAAAALSMAVSACVPIPLSETNYLPVGADVVASNQRSSGCAFGEARSTGSRQFANLRIGANLDQSGADSAKPHATMGLQIIDTGDNGTFRAIAVNPARIVLQDSGRSLTARQTNVTSRIVGRARPEKVTSAQLTFPAPSGIADDVTILFRPGAVTAGGRPVPMEPLRFRRTKTTLVYMFPCIPA